ncbi:uncharacterized protein LTR77_009227 [Saxophila tyrrhenica]|uniref:Uncharacterized protein n=1 Tax=Saxophila tyrrhenica TaxID=1690608 RepID=A0AAV9NZ39_9PEZI|nr:hypothetical protein LTR77_009227 [Saxophila tyrrhenica]
MPEKLINGIPVEEILNPIINNLELVERISHRKKAQELTIVDPDPQWPEYFKTFKDRILKAFDPQGDEQGGNDGMRVEILSINHVGSTSVPNLPAKATIDIDLVLSSTTLSSEPFYVPLLESGGFQYVLREPSWYEHRFFVAYEPMPCNLHVWGPKCAEVERHLIFRDRLRENDGDRELYGRTKREAMRVVREGGEGMVEYTKRKDEIIGGILGRAFQRLGYLID